MSSLSEVSVPRAGSPDASAELATPAPLPELRTGDWTRLGSSAVLGDAVTEQTLASLAESTRVAAGSQGYAVGWAEGQRAAREAARAEAEAVAAQHAEAEARRAAEHAAAVSALETAAAHLHVAVAGVCAALEEQATELAWQLTEELVGHELSVAGTDVVRRVLALLPAHPVARVRLHPADLPAGMAALGEPAGTGATVVADPGLTRGDALVEVDDHVLDLRLETAMLRVREALR